MYCSPWNLTSGPSIHTRWLASCHPTPKDQTPLLYSWITALICTSHTQHIYPSIHTHTHFNFFKLKPYHEDILHTSSDLPKLTSFFRQDQTHSGWNGGKKKKTLFLVPTQESKNKHQFIQSSIFELLNNNKNSFVSLAIEARWIYAIKKLCKTL